MTDAMNHEYDYALSRFTPSKFAPSNIGYRIVVFSSFFRTQPYNVPTEVARAFAVPGQICLIVSASGLSMCAASTHRCELKNHNSCGCFSGGRRQKLLFSENPAHLSPSPLRPSGYSSERRNYTTASISVARMTCLCPSKWSMLLCK